MLAPIRFPLFRAREANSLIVTTYFTEELDSVSRPSVISARPTPDAAPRLPATRGVMLAAATYPSTNISPSSVTGPTGPDSSDDFPQWSCTVLNAN
jgi:hypothetical protein